MSTRQWQLNSCRLQKPTLALNALEEAAQRLREAVSFSRGDPQPHNALGDTLMARADMAGDPSEALGFLNAAEQEGYAAALRLMSRDANALIGRAEVSRLRSINMAFLCLLIRFSNSHNIRFRRT